MIGQHEPVYFEGVEIADLIEVAVDGDRPAELELDDVYLEAIDQVLAPDDHATWPALHELADAVHAARRRRASTHG